MEGIGRGERKRELEREREDVFEREREFEKHGLLKIGHERIK